MFSTSSLFIRRSVQSATGFRRLLSSATQEIPPSEPYGEFYFDKLSIEKTTTPKPLPSFENLKFGHTFTDHMLEVDWTRSNGWGTPKIVPYQNFQVSPALSSLHYGIQIFEGLKAYLDKSGNARLFRPDMNLKRMNRSAQRMCLPIFKENEVMAAMKSLVLLDKHWIPNIPGYSLYVRPAMIATDPFLGIAPPNEAKFFVILSPVGPYYKEGFKPVSLFAGQKYIRAFPGGTGDSKVGPNYGPTILPQIEADSKGFTQVLWLTGPELNFTEVGTMNLFILWTNSEGRRELITPTLGDGTVLPGITRDSILTLARSWNEFPVRERQFTMADFKKAHTENRIHEVFGAGTAAVVSPVRRIHFDGVDYEIPLDPKDSLAGAGPLTKRFLTTLTAIQFGEVSHPWSVKLD